MRAVFSFPFVNFLSPQVLEYDFRRKTAKSVRYYKNQNSGARSKALILQYAETEISKSASYYYFYTRGSYIRSFHMYLFTTPLTTKHLCGRGVEIAAQQTSGTITYNCRRANVECTFSPAVLAIPKFQK